MDAPRALGLRLGLVMALSTLLFLGALRSFLSAIYYHNLTALGLNETALFALLLASPTLFLAPVHRLGAARVALGAAVVLALSRALMGPTWASAAYMPASGLAAASFLVLLPALAVLAEREGGMRTTATLALGAAAGLALDAALLLATGSRDPFSGGVFAVVFGLFAAVGFALLLPPGRDGAITATRPRGLFLVGAALGSWFFLQHVALGSPFALARWNGAAPVTMGIAIVVGLIAPLALAWKGAALNRGALIALHVLAALAVLDHALVQSPVLPALVVFAQATLVIDLALLLTRLGQAPLARAGRAMLGASLALLFFHFGFAFSFTFAYVPLGGFWHGAERWLVPLAFLVVLAGAWSGLRGGTRLPNLPRAAVVVALVVPLMLVTAGVALPKATVEAPAEDASLRVLSFNLHQGFNNAGAIDPGIFVAILRELDADVISLQESDTARFTSANLDILHIISRELGYYVYYGPPTREQSVGLSLLSRFPIAEASTHRLPTTTDNRFFVEARLDVNGLDVWVYAVHFGLEQPDREMQAAALLERAEARTPRILVGDFNSCPEGLCPDFDGPGDDVYARVTQDHDDAWVAAGHDATDPAGYTYEATDPYERIDYVFVSRDIIVESFDRVRTSEAIRASDHLPVLVTLRLP